MTKEKKKERDKAYYLKNKDRISASAKKRYANNPEYYKKKSKAWAINNPERRRETSRAGHKRRMAIDPSKRRKWYAAWARKRRASDPLFKLETTCRNRILSAISGHCKSAKTQELLGCSVEFLKAHLESKFKIGMHWDNHGRFGWHVDHIIPCYNFDLSDPWQQRKCFHFTNLQPLWWNENLEKSNRMTAFARSI